MYKEDELSLQSGQWLTDPIISHFVYHHLNSMGQYFNAVETEALKMRNDSKVQISQNRTFFVVNHGQKHWTLLMFHNPTLWWFHLDSMGSSKLYIENTVNRLANSLNIRSREIVVLTSERSNTATSQQRNGFDCGVFVVAFAKALNEAHNNNKIDSNNLVNSLKQIIQDVSQDSVDKLRIEMSSDFRNELLREKKTV